jgi:hypothetical protein
MAAYNAAMHIEPFQPDCDPTSTAFRWKRWIDRFDNLMLAFTITDVARKKALLLHFVGETVYDVFQGLVVPDVADQADANVENVYTVAKAVLTAHFSPAKNSVFEVYNFRLARQNAGECIDSYHARLRAMAKYCQFTDVDNEIKSQIIQTCVSSRL